MKNFSVNTADFDSLSISGESPIVQSDLGTAPNQIPLNKDLGSLAYMNAPQIEDLNVDTLELREIAAELSETAVDVFVYDTRKDSDGGAWRERTSHTSWYNEELNTATRGGRREFPAVAVIVAEADKVTIYDGDDPDLNMWMVFESSVSTGLGTWLGRSSGIYRTSVKMLNGLLCITSTASTAVPETLIRVDFIKESCLQNATGGFIFVNNVVSDRNSSWDGRYTIDYSEGGIVNMVSVNDVAMTVLPNALIDAETGLPVPTIAVATDGGVSVIRDDGSVEDIDASGVITHVEFAKKENHIIFFSAQTSGVFRARNIHTGAQDSHWYNTGGDMRLLDNCDSGSGNYIKISNEDKVYIGQNGFGVNFLNQLRNDFDGNGSVAYVSSTYNTGWMPGDTKLATLSDTKIEKIGHKNLITNGIFSTGTDWSLGEDWSISNGLLTKVSGSNSSNTSQDIECIVGEEYVITFELISKTTGAVGVYTVSGGDLTNVQNYYNTPGVYSEKFTATSNNVTIAIRAGSTAVLSVDNVSMVPVGEGELITNGTFDDGTTGWVARSGSSISVSGGQLTAVCSGNYDGVQVDSSYLPSLESGKRYVMSVDIDSISNGEVGFGVVSGNTFAGITSPGIYSVTLTASNTTEVWIDNRNSSVSTFVLNSVSIRLAEDDRSVNDNGLQVFGEITKSPVAPGADLVAYSGFSANNYLAQPYNSDLDFGTGDYYCSLWINSPTSTDDSPIFCQGRYITGMYALVLNSNGDGNSIKIGDRGGSCSIYRHEGEGWIQISVKRTAGLIQSYKNGVLQDSVESNYDINKSVSSAGLMIGSMLTSSGSIFSKSFQGKLALFRISATAPTDDQIAKIYRDEKPLFQDGAQATLYGTSDAVTALAYDDSDGLLHVGTASGRSSFNGLKRVDNTTTAVSTAISATEGLVIEQ